jgi:prevent-host-death family protein
MALTARFWRRQSDRWLYDSYMTEMAVSEARDHLAELIDATRRSGDPVFVTRRGRRVAVILDPEVYEQLLEDAEEALDLAELRAAREDDDYIPWDEVKADLGLA